MATQGAHVMKSHGDLELSRRNLLQMGLTATGAALLAGGLELSSSLPAQAQPIPNPDAALNSLIEGNKRYVAGRLTGQRDLPAQRRRTENKQEPFASVLACADSRVPVELVFDQGIGDIFVTRVAGNVITPEIIGSLEYGAAVLGTKVILVLGHSNCGAVKATIHAEEVPGQISSLFPHIQPAVDEAGHDPVAVTKANAKLQAKLLRQASTVIAGLVKSGKVKVTSGYYDVGSGVVTLLE